MTLVEQIASYQETIGNTAAPVGAYLDHLRHEGARCVLTGQQVGLATGPYLTVLKAITCVQEARARGAVPIFWAHTEDHDVAEVARATVLGGKGNLHKYRASLPAGYFVEDLPWLPSHQAVLAAYMEAVGVSAETWKEAARGATRYAEVMIRLLAYIMEGSGLLFIEPRLLRPYAEPFFARELKEAAGLRALLQKESQGVFAIEEDHTNLFYKDPDAKRVKIRTCAEGFCIGDQVWGLDALLQEPATRFSTGVAARPLLQDTLLPTEAIVAGPSESRYLRTLVKYYQTTGVVMPEIVPRRHHTFVPVREQRWLEQLGLSSTEIGVDPESIALQKERGQVAELPPQSLHYLRNLLCPYGRPQERVFSWWQFSDDRGSYRIMEKDAAIGQMGSMAS